MGIYQPFDVELLFVIEYESEWKIVKKRGVESFRTLGFNCLLRGFYIFKEMTKAH